MKRKTITIGRDSDNMISINKPDISGHHVRITQTDTNSFFVEDLNSVNYTFVDGAPVRRATIGIEEELRLSKDTYIDLKEIFKIGVSGQQVNNMQVYLESFIKLKTLWDESERQKIKVRRIHQRKSAFLRTGIMLGIIALALPFRSLLGPVFIGVSIVAGGIAGAFIPVSTPDELRTLEERLYRNYACPHCEAKLGQWSWYHYAETGKCSSCKKSFKKTDS